MSGTIFDNSHDARGLPQIFLTPGTLFCGPEPVVVGTVLGSCVAVCLVDRYQRGAGMNHFVLAYNPGGDNSLRYGDVALARLRERMGQLGCDDLSLRAKVFGGAAVLPFGDAGDTVGTKNVEAALAWLRRLSIPVIARRTGGTNGLLIRFHTGSGTVLVRKVASGMSVDWSASVPIFDSNRHRGQCGGLWTPASATASCIITDP